MFTFAADKATARISGEFYVNAINVMRGASAVSTYVGLPEQEAFDIEYWLLEEAKLQRMPKPKSLAGRIAFVTGGAGGIGQGDGGAAVGGRRLRRAGRHRRGGAGDAIEELGRRFGRDVVRSAKLERHRGGARSPAFATSAVEFGGIDISSPTPAFPPPRRSRTPTLAMWDRNIDILAKGYFLVSREAFRTFKQQKIGGNVVFIASKNGLAASPNAAAYCTAKAAEIHLARCLALEGADHQIRVNTVNPDAVLRGSKIWVGEWREQRAAAYNMTAGRAGRALSQALDAEALGVPGRHRRGGVFPGFRLVGQIDRQHHQRRRRQRAELYPLAETKKAERWRKSKRSNCAWWTLFPRSSARTPSRVSFPRRRRSSPSPIPTGRLAPAIPTRSAPAARR
jgi:NAD(P)-dependent dehydrogenase (short-subunit alcohol dehydrogenase family)